MRVSDGMHPSMSLFYCTYSFTLNNFFHKKTGIFSIIYKHHVFCGLSSFQEKNFFDPLLGNFASRFSKKVIKKCTWQGALDCCLDVSKVCTKQNDHYCFFWLNSNSSTGHFHTGDCSFWIQILLLFQKLKHSWNKMQGKILKHIRAR